MTWMGAFFVEDTRYEAILKLELDLVGPDGSSVIVKDLPLDSRSLALTFWERNPLLSWGTVQTLVVPPFWTSDDEDRTYESLTRRSLTVVAAKLKRYLLKKFPNKGSLENARIKDFL
jgi:hypothetical protein